MASAGAVSTGAKIVGLVPISEGRVGTLSARSRVSLGGLTGASNAGIAARSPVQLFVPQQQTNVRWRPLVVTNAATKIKSPAEADWKVKREALLKAKMRSVTPKEALALQKDQGYTIVDVRPEKDFNDARGHPAGAINVQVYRLIKEWTLWDISRRVAFAFFGIFQGTEENPEFLNGRAAVLPRSQVNTLLAGVSLAEVKASGLSKDDKIIVACVAGGTMKPTPNMAEGSQSRSLIAAYLLTLDGYTNVAHVEGGIRQWFKQDLPTEEVVED